MFKTEAVCLVITAVVVRVLYGLRPVTFAVWTNAALLSHSHPLIAVAAIETAIVLAIFAACWIVAELLMR